MYNTTMGPETFRRHLTRLTNSEFITLLKALQIKPNTFRAHEKENIIADAAERIKTLETIITG